MPKFDIAMIVTIEAPTYADALRDADRLAEGVGDAEELSVSAVIDYETDNDDQRVLYLHPAS